MATVKEIAPHALQPEHLRVAAYCRVSSDSEDQLHSYAAQIRNYTEVIAQHDGWDLVDVYADEGLTGTRVSLFLGNRLRLLSAERLAPRRDRTGGDKDHFFSHSSHIADDADQFLDLCKVQVSSLRMCQ